MLYKNINLESQTEYGTDNTMKKNIIIIAVILSILFSILLSVVIAERIAEPLLQEKCRNQNHERIIYKFCETPDGLYRRGSH